MMYLVISVCLFSLQNKILVTSNLILSSPSTILAAVVLLPPPPKTAHLENMEAWLEALKLSHLYDDLVRAGFDSLQKLTHFEVSCIPEGTDVSTPISSCLLHTLVALNLYLSAGFSSYPYPTLYVIIQRLPFGWYIPISTL